MGSWGPKIFQDDIAQDVIMYYKDQLKRNKSNEQVTNELLERFNFEINDEDEAPIFWFALADVQWKYGRLLPFLKEKALYYINSGKGVLNWKEAGEKNYFKRLKIIEEFKNQILSPMPEEKRITPYKFYYNDWNIGDVFAYQFNKEISKECNFHGKYCLFRVVNKTDSWPGNIIPVIHLYKWVGNEIPSIEIIDSLEWLPNIYLPKREYRFDLIINSKRQIPKKCLSYVGNINNIKPPTDEESIKVYSGTTFKNFEEGFIESFDRANFSIVKQKFLDGKLFVKENNCSIKLPLKPFEMDGELVNTFISIEGLTLPKNINDIKNELLILNFPPYPQQGYLDSSIYLQHKHIPIYVRTISFKEYNKKSKLIKISLDMDFKLDIINKKNESIFFREIYLSVE